MKIVLAGPFDTDLFRSLTGLQLAGAPAGHGGVPVTQLAAALRDAGHAVSVVTLDPAIDATCRFTVDDFNVTYCPLRAPPRHRTRERMLDLFGQEITALKNAIAAEAPDIVHAHWTYEYAEAAVRTRLPHLVTMHDLGWQVLFQSPDIYRAMRLVMKYRVMPRVTALSVVSPFMAPKVRSYCYCGPVTVIPNGTDVPSVDWSVVERKATGPLKIATVGNAQRLKNVQASITAHARLRQMQPEAELHLFGPGLDAGFTGQDGVVCHGQEPTRSLMRFLSDEATVLVHPSRLETFGMIIAEAKMRAVPVVSGQNSGGVGYVCGQDAGCALVDIESPAAIAGAVAQLTKSEADYRRHSRAARTDAAERFDIATSARRYIEAYNGVLNR